MSGLAPPLPVHRSELVVRPLGEGGQYVVKDPRSGAYYHLGEEEHFLLNGLTGRQSAAELRTAFAERFGKPLTEEDLEDFLEMATAQGFLIDEASGGRKSPGSSVRFGALDQGAGTDSNRIGPPGCDECLWSMEDSRWRARRREPRDAMNVY